MRRWLSLLGINLLKMALMLLAISVVVFVLMGLSPLDPLTQYIGGESAAVGEEQAARIAEKWGLNDPYPQRYIRWMGSMLKGDLGISLSYNRPVIDIIKERFPASLALMLTAWISSGLLGFALGIVAAMNEGKLADKLIKWYSLTLASTPTFWVGLLILALFSVYLGWFPVGLSVPAGVAASSVTLADRARHIFLPALTLSLIGVAGIALHTRQKLIDVLASDYLLFAFARGEGRWEAFHRHCIRNSLLPALTIQFGSLGEIFGGSALAEQIFSYPGLSQSAVQAGIRGDIPLLMGISMFSALFIFTGNAIANISYGLIDPNIREEYRRG